MSVKMEKVVDQFNREVAAEFEAIRDFIIAHYHVTERADSDYWRDCRDMTVPDSLAHKLELARSNGRIFRDNNELFSEPSWAAVLYGQGLASKGYHPFVDNMSDAELQGLMTRVRGWIAEQVGRQPTHAAYLANL